MQVTIAHVQVPKSKESTISDIHNHAPCISTKTTNKTKGMAKVGNQQFNHIYRCSTATGPHVTIPMSGTINRLHQNITPVTITLLFLELNYNKETLENKSPSPDTRGDHQKHAARTATAPRAISNTCGTRRGVRRSHHQSHIHMPLAGIAIPIRNRRPQSGGGREGGRGEKSGP